MLYKHNIVALVGGGQMPKYPENKLMLWDDCNNNILISKLRVSELQDSLKWENGRDSEIFPHFYGILEFKFIVKTVKREEIHEF